MRNYVFVFAIVSACAASSGERRQSSGAERASTAAAEALIRGDYEGALANADRGLRRDATDPWLLYNRGLALAGLNRLDESLAVLSAAEANFNDHWGRSLAIYRRALALEFAGQCEEASTELSRYAALVRDTHPQMAQEALAHVEFCLGGTREQVAERDQEARQIAAQSEARSRQADVASTAVVRALTLADYPLALQLAEKGLALSPEDPWLLYNKGAALAGLDRTDEALATLRAAERRFDANSLRGRAVAVYRRAIALEAVGRCEEEAQELQRFAALANQPDVAQHTQTHLKFCRLTRDSKVF